MLWNPTVVAIVLSCHWSLAPRGFRAWRLGPRSGLGPVGEPAQVMPLAIGAAALLLLMSLALHGLALQARLQGGALERLRREEDVLVSGAHRLVAALNGSHGCLLAVPLERWEVDGAACATPAVLATLRRAEVMTAPVVLLAWQPQPDGVTAVLELGLEPGPGRGARRGRFEVRLLGVPQQGVDLRTRFLTGGLP